jgi:hypothetical protein
MGVPGMYLTWGDIPHQLEFSGVSWKFNNFKCNFKAFRSRIKHLKKCLKLISGRLFPILNKIKKMCLVPTNFFLTETLSNHCLIHETGQNYPSSHLQLVSKSQFCLKNPQRITLTFGRVMKTWAWWSLARKIPQPADSGFSWPKAITHVFCPLGNPTRVILCIYCYQTTIFHRPKVHLSRLPHHHLSPI